VRTSGLGFDVWGIPMSGSGLESETEQGKRPRLWQLLRFRGELLVTVGTMGNAALAFVWSIVVVRSLHPWEMGVIQSVMLLPTYAAMLHFGVFNGLNWALGYYRGQGDLTKVQGLVNGSWQAAKLIAAVGALVGFGLTLYCHLSGRPWLYTAASALATVSLVVEPFCCPEDWELTNSGRLLFLVSWLPDSFLRPM
jgi:hypothetical protein